MAATRSTGSKRQSRGRAGAFLHGGPGAGSAPVHSPFLRPAILSHRRVRPSAAAPLDAARDLQDNTTAHLVADMEKLRIHLVSLAGCCFGGSWGSTLALALRAEAPSARRRSSARHLSRLGPEIDWFLNGMRTVFPEAWRDFVEQLPEGERGDLLGSYYRA